MYCFMLCLVGRAVEVDGQKVRMLRDRALIVYNFLWYFVANIICICLIF